jgi:hypothetical protein
MEALLIANYMLFPWRGLLNNYQYCRLCVATIAFAFQKQENKLQAAAVYTHLLKTTFV